jgi:hypothetical protein
MIESSLASCSSFAATRILNPELQNDGSSGWEINGELRIAVELTLHNRASTL